MSHPNGEQADQFHTTSATNQVPPGFQQAAQFTAPAATPGVEPVTQPFHAPSPYAAEVPQTAGAAPTTDPATQPVYAPAGVPAAPATQPVYPRTGASSPAAPSTDPATQPVYPQTGAFSPAAPSTDPATQPLHAPGAAPVVPGSEVATVAPGSAVPAVVGGHPYAPEGSSAFPVTGVPVSGYPVVMEPKKKRTGTTVLVVATIVLGLATAGFGTMYFLEANARGKADQKVSEQTALLAAADIKLKDTETKLSASKEENTKLTQDLTGAKNKTDEVTKARDALAACMQASEAYAASKNTNTARDLIVKCTEAEKYY